MNWLFWALLILGIVLLISPLLGVLEAALSGALWLIGGLLLIGAAIWAIVTLSRGAAASAPPA